MTLTEADQPASRIRRTRCANWCFIHFTSDFVQRFGFAAAACRAGSRCRRPAPAWLKGRPGPSRSRRCWRHYADLRIMPTWVPFPTRAALKRSAQARVVFERRFLPLTDHWRHSRASRPSHVRPFSPRLCRVVYALRWLPGRQIDEYVLVSVFQRKRVTQSNPRYCLR
jgi:hypothetical protein